MSYSYKSTDHELWNSILNGDPAAFSILFERHWSKVYTTVFHYLKDEEACKEITHDIFLNIWLRREHLRILSFPAYLQAAARYHVYRHMKHVRALPVTYRDNWDTLSEQVCRNEGDEQLRYRELENNVDAWLRDLPKRCREVFILSRKQYLTNEQIAGKLGISKRTVENQLTHALHHLRTLLKDTSVVFLAGFALLLLYGSFATFGQ
jgi:RNA polymerase sigma-70 factor (family 1)